MPNYTRKAILDEFEAMLKKMPFNKITVTAIVAKTEISLIHFTIILEISMIC